MCTITNVGECVDVTDTLVPTDLWEEENEAVITTWFVDNGAAVAKDELLAEIMVETAQHEIHSTADGALTIMKQVDEVVAKGDVIAKVE